MIYITKVLGVWHSSRFNKNKFPSYFILVTLYSGVEFSAIVSLGQSHCSSSTQHSKEFHTRFAKKIRLVRVRQIDCSQSQISAECLMSFLYILSEYCPLNQFHILPFIWFRGLKNNYDSPWKILESTNVLLVQCYVEFWERSQLFWMTSRTIWECCENLLDAFQQFVASCPAYLLQSVSKTFDLPAFQAKNLVPKKSSKYSWILCSYLCCRSRFILGAVRRVVGWC